MPRHGRSIRRFMLWGGAASAVLALLIAIPAFGSFGFLTWWGPNGSTPDSLGPHIEVP